MGRAKAKPITFANCDRWVSLRSTHPTITTSLVPLRTSSFGFVMNTPKVPKRYRGPKPPGPDAILGDYEAGLKNEKFALLFGQTIATWVHVEDFMIQVLQDLLGSKSAPARQIFHSVFSNNARKVLMLSCLQNSSANARKADIYEMIILQFSKLNTQRNTFLHGLWYTHE